MKTARLALALFLLALPQPSLAQDASPERLDRLERDIMLMQRQMARGGGSTATVIGESGLSSGNPADIEVRMTALEEQMREMRGKIEENEFQLRRLNENFEKMQKDTEFRFSELSGGAAPAGVTVEAPKSEGERKPLEEVPVVKMGDEAMPKITTPGQTSGGDGVLRLPKAGNFSTPREHYNYAFRLLNQTQYEEAASTFDSFTRKYPKDPLVGNAYYWKGETFYIRRDYVNAADNFRQGFEALPDGPKAADNLLKLAMSLDALGRGKEACVVLGQVVTKFKKSSTSVTEKADQEQKRIGCK